MKTRTSNLELLRIIGILMIVMGHFCGQGGVPAHDSFPLLILNLA